MLFFDRKPTSAILWTEELWIYDLRTNSHFASGLPDPDVLAAQVVQDLQAALELLREIANDIAQDGRCGIFVV